MSNIEFKDADHSIFELLAWIRAKPAFLDGQQSVKRLRSFLVGYDCGLGRAEFVLRDRVVFDHFNDWVAARLGFGNSTSGWCNMMLERTGDDDAKAYLLFYDLLDEFCKEKGVAK